MVSVACKSCFVVNIAMCLSIVVDRSVGLFGCWMHNNNRQQFAVVLLSTNVLSFDLICVLWVSLLFVYLVFLFIRLLNCRPQLFNCKFVVFFFICFLFISIFNHHCFVQTSLAAAQRTKQYYNCQSIQLCDFFFIFHALRCFALFSRLFNVLLFNLIFICMEIVLR